MGRKNKSGKKTFIQVGSNYDDSFSWGDTPTNVECNESWGDVPEEKSPEPVVLFRQSVLTSTANMLNIPATYHFGPVNHFGFQFARDIITLENPGREHDLEWYVSNSIYKTPLADLFVAPCGSGKTKYALGPLLKRYPGKSKILIITERILSADSTFNHYKKNMSQFPFISGVEGRYGRKSYFAGNRNNINLLIMTVNAYVDRKPNFVDSKTLVLLDEAHNLTEGMLTAIHRDSGALVLMTASPVNFRESPYCDLKTPLPSQIAVAYEPNPLETMSQMLVDNIDRLHDAGTLICCPTYHSANELMGQIEELNILALDENEQIVGDTTNIKRKYKTLLVTRDEGIPINKIEEFTKQPGIIIATDIIQESVTLHNKYFFDLGLRIKPKMDIYRISKQLLSMMSMKPKALIPYVDNDQLEITLSPANFTQFLGRAGRVRSDNIVVTFLTSEMTYDADLAFNTTGRLLPLCKSKGVQKLTPSEVRQVQALAMEMEKSYQGKTLPRSFIHFHNDLGYNRYRDHYSVNHLIQYVKSIMVINNYRVNRVNDLGIDASTDSVNESQTNLDVPVPLPAPINTPEPILTKPKPMSYASALSGSSSRSAANVIQNPVSPSESAQSVLNAPVIEPLSTCMDAELPSPPESVVNVVESPAPIASDCISPKKFEFNVSDSELIEKEDPKEFRLRKIGKMKNHNNRRLAKNLKSLAPNRSLNQSDLLALVTKPIPTKTPIDIIKDSALRLIELKEIHDTQCACGQWISYCNNSCYARSISSVHSDCLAQITYFLNTYRNGAASNASIDIPNFNAYCGVSIDSTSYTSSLSQNPLDHFDSFLAYLNEYFSVNVLVMWDSHNLESINFGHSTTIILSVDKSTNALILCNILEDLPLPYKQVIQLPRPRQFPSLLDAVLYACEIPVYRPQIIACINRYVSSYSIFDLTTLNHLKTGFELLLRLTPSNAVVINQLDKLITEINRLWTPLMPPSTINTESPNKPLLVGKSKKARRNRQMEKLMSPNVDVQVLLSVTKLIVGNLYKSTKEFDYCNCLQLREFCSESCSDHQHCVQSLANVIAHESGSYIKKNQLRFLNSNYPIELVFNLLSRQTNVNFILFYDFHNIHFINYGHKATSIINVLPLETGKVSYTFLTLLEHHSIPTNVAPMSYFTILSEFAKFGDLSINTVPEGLSTEHPELMINVPIIGPQLPTYETLIDYFNDLRSSKDVKPNSNRATSSQRKRKSRGMFRHYDVRYPKQQVTCLQKLFDNFHPDTLTIHTVDEFIGYLKFNKVPISFDDNSLIYYSVHRNIVGSNHVSKYEFFGSQKLTFGEFRKHRFLAHIPFFTDLFIGTPHHTTSLAPALTMSLNTARKEAELFPFSLTGPNRQLLQSKGANLPNPVVAPRTPHPAAKCLENMSLSYVTSCMESPITCISMKSRSPKERHVCKEITRIIQKVLIIKDIARFTKQPIITGTTATIVEQLNNLGSDLPTQVLVHDVLPYLTPSDIYHFFLKNPTISELYCTAVIPPETLYNGSEEWPSLYSIDYHNDVILYSPDCDTSSGYHQPLAARIWLSPNQIEGPEFNLYSSVVNSNFSHHVILITRQQVMLPDFTSLETSDVFFLHPVEAPFRPINERRTNRKVCDSLVRFASRAKNFTVQEFHAKVTQVTVSNTLKVPPYEIENSVHWVLQCMRDKWVTTNSILAQTINWIVFLLTFRFIPAVVFNIYSLVFYRRLYSLWTTPHPNTFIKKRYIVVNGHLKTPYFCNRVWEQHLNPFAGAASNRFDISFNRILLLFQLMVFPKIFFSKVLRFAIEHFNTFVEKIITLIDYMELDMISLAYLTVVILITYHLNILKPGPIMSAMWLNIKRCSPRCVSEYFLSQIITFVLGTADGVARPFTFTFYLLHMIVALFPGYFRGHIDLRDFMMAGPFAFNRFVTPLLIAYLYEMLVNLIYIVLQPDCTLFANYNFRPLIDSAVNFFRFLNMDYALDYNVTLFSVLLPLHFVFLIPLYIFFHLIPVNCVKLLKFIGRGVGKLVPIIIKSLKHFVLKLFKAISKAFKFLFETTIRFLKNLFEFVSSPFLASQTLFNSIMSSIRNVINEQQVDTPDYRYASDPLFLNILHILIIVISPLLLTFIVFVISFYYFFLLIGIHDSILQGTLVLVILSPLHLLHFLGLINDMTLFELIETIRPYVTVYESLLFFVLLMYLANFIFDLIHKYVGPIKDFFLSLYQFLFKVVNFIYRLIFGLLKLICCCYRPPPPQLPLTDDDLIDDWSIASVLGDSFRYVSRTSERTRANLQELQILLDGYYDTITTQTPLLIRRLGLRARGMLVLINTQVMADAQLSPWLLPASTEDTQMFPNLRFHNFTRSLINMLNTTNDYFNTYVQRASQDLRPPPNLLDDDFFSNISGEEEVQPVSSEPSQDFSRNYALPHSDLDWMCNVPNCSQHTMGPIWNTCSSGHGCTLSPGSFCHACPTNEPLIPLTTEETPTVPLIVGTIMPDNPELSTPSYSPNHTDQNWICPLNNCNQHTISDIWNTCASGHGYSGPDNEDCHACLEHKGKKGKGVTKPHKHFDFDSPTPKGSYTKPPTKSPWSTKYASQPEVLPLPESVVHSQSQPPVTEEYVIPANVPLPDDPDEEILIPASVLVHRPRIAKASKEFSTYTEQHGQTIADMMKTRKKDVIDDISSVQSILEDKNYVSKHSVFEVDKVIPHHVIDPNLTLPEDFFRPLDVSAGYIDTTALLVLMGVVSSYRKWPASQKPHKLNNTLSKISNLPDMNRDAIFTRDFHIECGDPGSGKSFPIMNHLINTYVNTGSNYMVVTPTVNLCVDWKRNICQNCATGVVDGITSYPENFRLNVYTFEVALVRASEPDVVIFDEFTQYYKGFLNLFIALAKPDLKVILLFDPCQTIWYSENNILRYSIPAYITVLPGLDQYLVGTRRLSPNVATVFNIPTLQNQYNGNIYLSTVEFDNTVKIVGSHRTVQNRDDHSRTVPQSQGGNYIDVNIIVDIDWTKFESIRSLWTAVTRAKNNLYITLTPSYLTSPKRNLILDKLIETSHFQADGNSYIVPSDQPIVNIYDYLLPIIYELIPKRKLIANEADFLNHDRVDFSRMYLIYDEDNPRLELSEEVDTTKFYPQLVINEALYNTDYLDEEEFTGLDRDGISTLSKNTCAYEVIQGIVFKGKSLNYVIDEVNSLPIPINFDKSRGMSLTSLVTILKFYGFNPTFTPVCSNLIPYYPTNTYTEGLDKLREYRPCEIYYFPGHVSLQPFSPENYQNTSFVGASVVNVPEMNYAIHKSVFYKDYSTWLNHFIVEVDPSVAAHRELPADMPIPFYSIAPFPISNLPDLMNAPSVVAYTPNREYARVFCQDMKQWNRRPYKEDCYTVRDFWSATALAQSRTVKLIVYCGCPGSNKSSDAFDLVLPLFNSPNPPVRVCTPNSAMRDMVRSRFKRLGVNTSEFGYVFPTFDTLGFQGLEKTVVIDDVGQLWAGQLDAILFLHSYIETVIVTVDPCQSKRIMPVAYPNSVKLVPTSQYLSSYASFYRCNNYRCAKLVGLTLGFMGSERPGTFIMLKVCPNSVPILTADTRSYSIHKGRGVETYEINAAQGIDFDGDYALEINAPLFYMDDAQILLALTRGKANVFLIDRTGGKSIAPQSPILAALLSLMSTTSEVTEYTLQRAELGLTTTGRGHQIKPVSYFVARHMSLSIPNYPLASTNLHQFTEDFVGGLEFARSHLDIHTPWLSDPVFKINDPGKARTQLKTVGLYDPYYDLTFDERADKYSREQVDQFNQMTNQIPETFDNRELGLKHSRHDAATYNISITKRIRPTPHEVTLSEYNHCHKQANKLIKAFKYATGITKQTLNRDLLECCFDRAQQTWLRNRSENDMLNNSLANDPEWDPLYTRLFLKSQTVRKIDAINGPAKAGQIVTTFPLSNIMDEAVYASYLQLIIEKLMPPNIFLYSGKTQTDLESWYNKYWYEGEVTYTDYTAWDSSIDSPFLRFDEWLMDLVGIPQDFIDKYRHRKMNLRTYLGPLPIFQCSGDRWTWILNTLRNIAVTHMKFSIPKSTPQMYSGDDMILCGYAHIRASFKPDDWKLKVKVRRAKQGVFCGIQFGGSELSIDAKQLLARLLIADATPYTPQSTYDNYLTLAATFSSNDFEDEYLMGSIVKILKKHINIDLVDDNVRL